MELITIDLQDSHRPVQVAVGSIEDKWRIQRYVAQSERALLQLEVYDELTGRKKADQQDIAKEMEARHV